MDGNTALHYASLAGQSETVKFLLAHCQADTSIDNKVIICPFCFAQLYLSGYFMSAPFRKEDQRGPWPPTEKPEKCFRRVAVSVLSDISTPGIIETILSFYCLMFFHY